MNMRSVLNIETSGQFGVRAGDGAPAANSMRRGNLSLDEPGGSARGDFSRPVTGKAYFDVGHSLKDQKLNRRRHLPDYAAWEIHPVMAFQSINSGPLLFKIALLLVCLGDFARFTEHADDRPA
jgi:hypothetical protein